MRRGFAWIVALVFVVATVAIFADADAKTQIAFGIAVAQNGLWREALYRFQRAVEIDPSYAAAYNNLAVAYEHEGSLEQAGKAYERANELEPKNDMIRQNYEMFREIHDRAGNRDVPK